MNTVYFIQNNGLIIKTQGILYKIQGTSMPNMAAIDKYRVLYPKYG